MSKKEQKRIPSAAFDPYEYKKETYKGVDIYTKALPWANCTFFKWMIANGAQDDKPGKEGVAHFLEHIVFDGNPQYKDKKAIDLFSKEFLLDTLNAHTGFTHTCFICKFLPQKTEPALSGMYNLIFKPLMREEDIEHERRVITQEGWSLLLNEKYINYLKKWNMNVFSDIPERLRMASPLGWIDTVAKIGKKDLLDVHKKYTRENSIIIITGVINKSTINEVKKIIDQVPNGKKRPNPKIPLKIHLPKERRWVKSYTEIGKTEAKQALLNIERVLENKTTDAYTLGLITTVLREILFRRLRHDNSWCYGVGATFWQNTKFITQSIWVKVSPENVKEAEKIIWDTIDRFILGEYKEDTERERNVVLERTLASEFLSGAIAEEAEKQISRGEKIETLNEYLKGVSKAEYNKAAKHLSLYFKRDDAFVEITIPKEFKKKIK
ncbi:MAG: pitrilysin family protein [bacterium]